MEYIDALDSAIEEALKKYTAGLDEFGLLFSGGLDSSLLSKVCTDIGKEPTLISVYMGGSLDSSTVEKDAASLGLGLIKKVISEGEVSEYVEKVCSAISTNNPLDIAIGVPILCAFETAVSSGIESVISGQGADELFGGFHRYLNFDPERLEVELKRDFETINIARDRTIAEYCGIRLLTPYLDEVVVRLGLNIPIRWKIRNGIRKYILREVAKKRGLPEAIWSKEKKAIQYSTGVDKVVKKVLRNRRLVSRAP